MFASGAGPEVAVVPAADREHRDRERRRGRSTNDRSRQNSSNVGCARFAANSASASTTPPVVRLAMSGQLSISPRSVDLMPPGNTTSWYSDEGDCVGAIAEEVLGTLRPRRCSSSALRSSRRTSRCVRRRTVAPRATRSGRARRGRTGGSSRSPTGRRNHRRRGGGGPSATYPRDAKKSASPTKKSRSTTYGVNSTTTPGNGSVDGHSVASGLTELARDRDAVAHRDVDHRAHDLVGHRPSVGPPRVRRVGQRLHRPDCTHACTHSYRSAR